ncbi:hypothetical protein A1O1_00816 [Capronia coronata CBS 617.96]|uniref:NmrA-like domain-containing protein n=1 Tax=Capronia coronata CBS 617.96 TaxID=1182541 RepID=W9YT18_9EURO|nr:uncharacterized protein A1O1_00816 [Capronia coronata CBS 617.96]EXJ95693.1 hypothetical protein A1O1_00816 [Capronia coronata CBS 617.96]
MSRAILITGATGKQGGAVVNALVAAKADFQILALTRDTQSPSAQRLAQKSPKIKLVTGNLDLPDEIFSNAKEATSAPVWGVFSVQIAIGGKAKLTEEEQGKALIDAALANNVEHFVYSSVDRGDSQVSNTNPTNIPHFISKHNIEQHLFKTTRERQHQAGQQQQQQQNNKHTLMRYTVLRPVAFLDNLIPGFFGKVFSTSYQIALREKPLQLIAASDIGVVGAQAFLRPDEFSGKSISLAGDELTFQQFREIFEERTGQTLPTTYGFVARMIMWMSKEFGSMFQWFYDEGFGADIEECRKINPGMKDFATWLDKESQFETR